jgi:hypothetical protein
MTKRPHNVFRQWWGVVEYCGNIPIKGVDFVRPDQLEINLQFIEWSQGHTGSLLELSFWIDFDRRCVIMQHVTDPHSQEGTSTYFISLDIFPVWLTFLYSCTK